MWDLGDALLMRNDGVEDRILLTNIVNVRQPTLISRPPRITLSLKHPCRFGSEVTFCPLQPLNPFSKNAIFLELKERVESIHQKGSQ